MSSSRTAVEDEFGSGSQCGCCGRTDDPRLMVHLGDRPEVALCRSCARWAAKQAWEIDDRSKSGPLAIARDRFRNLTSLQKWTVDDLNHKGIKAVAGS